MDMDEYGLTGTVYLLPYLNEIGLIYDAQQSGVSGGDGVGGGGANERGCSLVLFHKVY